MTMNAYSYTPTYDGYIKTSQDVLIVVEACLRGELCHVPRKARHDEQEYLLKCGNVFVFEENASGISEWEDGREWDLDQQSGGLTTFIERTSASKPKPNPSRISDESTVPGMKKIVSHILCNGVTHHLVAYESAASPSEIETHMPSEDSVLRAIRPRENLTIQESRY